MQSREVGQIVRYSEGGNGVRNLREYREQKEERRLWRASPNYLILESRLDYSLGMHQTLEI
jgi:hypothetical protein